MEVNNFGINSSINYKIALANNQGYKYGNKLTLNSIAYYKINSRAGTLMPNAGLSYEKTAGNSLNGSKIILNDGLPTGSYETGGYIQTPLSQELAKGQTKLNMKGMIHITFAL
jgi:hypothetical protein